MSKRNLKKYLSELNKEQLENQFLEMYEKFPAVKVYYNFVFNPNEDNLLRDAKTKILNEYFPIRGKRPKMRRSTAQKFIKHFITLGVDAFVIADLMLFSIETAQKLTAEKPIYSESFFKSMLLSFKQCISFLIEKNIFYDFKSRIDLINQVAQNQNWYNCDEFNAIIDKFEY